MFFKLLVSKISAVKVIGALSEHATGSPSPYYLYCIIQYVVYFIRSRLFRHFGRQRVAFSKFYRHNVILLAFFHEHLMFFVHNFLFDLRENLRKLCYFKNNILNNKEKTQFRKKKCHLVPFSLAPDYIITYYNTA